MKIKNLSVMVLIALLVMPFVLADSKLLDADIAVGSNEVFYDSTNTEREIRVEDADKEEKKCVIYIDDVKKYIMENDDLIFMGLRIRLKNAEDNGCEIVIEEVDNPYVSITSLEVGNFEPDEHGYMFVPDGSKVIFEATINNPTNCFILLKIDFIIPFLVLGIRELDNDLIKST